jgi:hypothetical protein
MTARTLLSVAALAAAGLLLVWQVGKLLDDPTVWPPDDFVEYWAAGRLCLHGQDPYSPPLLLDLERQAGRDTDEAVMMWNPPWTLPVVMPLGALPARAAQLTWLFVGLAAIGFSADRLWRTYGGPAELRWVGWAVPLTFVPTYIVLNAGQIGPLLLLGAALFVWLDRTGRPALAGAAAALLAIKPHLAYLLWLAILLDAVVNRRWKVLVGGLAAGLIAAVLPLAFNPDVYAQYHAALRDHPPAQWVSLTLGTVLRVLLGEDRFWLQFVPVLLGVGWFAWHWRRHARTWDWAEQTPVLLLVSFVTSPYGAWHFDLVLLLVPLVALAAGLARKPHSQTTWAAAAVYLAANGVMLGLSVAEVWSFWFAWCAPLVLGLYVLTRRPVPA